MILVQAIDLDAGRVTLDLGVDEWSRGDASVATLVTTAAQIGARVLHLRCGERQQVLDVGAGAGPRPPQSRWPLLAHTAVRTASGVRYTAQVPHRPQIYRGILAYTELLLRAAGATAADCALVRLVIYELCVNTVEHGEPLELEPTLEIGFDIRPEAIQGWVRDVCARFDPVGFRPDAIARLVGDHARRGYGLRIVHRVVDSLQHAHDGRGNHVSFVKELTHEAAT